MSVLESLYTGTPVVSFRRGGPADIIEDGVSGFLVEVEKVTDEEMAVIIKDKFTKIKQRDLQSYVSELD